MVKYQRSSSFSPKPIYFTGILKLIRYSDHHSSFGCAVEFCDCHCSNICCSSKLSVPVQMHFDRSIRPAQEELHEEHPELLFPSLFLFLKVQSSGSFYYASRPAVSIMTTSYFPATADLTESKATEAGSDPICCLMIPTPALSAQI